MDGISRKVEGPKISCLILLIVAIFATYFVFKFRSGRRVMGRRSIRLLGFLVVVGHPTIFHFSPKLLLCFYKRGQ